MPVIECAGACTVTVIHELSLPPFQLSTEEGAAIASAVLAVWAVGFGFRAMVRVLRDSDGTTNEEREI